MRLQSVVKAFPIVMLFAAGCDNILTRDGPPVGSYSAIIFMTTSSSGQTDQLLQGSSLNITLAENGTTSGHLHIAASATTAALDADMAGTWQRHGDEIEFNQPADTFMNDLVFTFQPIATNTWHLFASQVIQGTQINITLANTT